MGAFRIRSVSSYSLLLSQAHRPYLVARLRSSASPFSTARVVMAPTPWDPSATPYPKVRRDESFVEDFKSQSKGTVAVADPYHWLSDPESAETAAFVQAQGQFAKAYTNANPHAEAFKKELTKNWDYPRCAFERDGGRVRAD